jgi:hypothetical protein
LPAPPGSDIVPALSNCHGEYIYLFYIVKIITNSEKAKVVGNTFRIDTGLTGMVFVMNSSNSDLPEIME